MRDKRPVDELSIEELEHILAIRKREERQRRLDRMQRAGRVVATGDGIPEPAVTPPLRDSLGPPPALPEVPPVVPTTPVPLAAPDAPPRFEDDLDAGEFGDPGEKDRFWKQFVSQALLLVEVAAVVGLIYLGYQMFTAITTLERETASAQELANQQRLASIPTLEPTPTLRLEDIVLPGGHLPPRPGQAPTFNYAEVPVELVSFVAAQVMAPPIQRPPETDDTAKRLIIPKINVDQTIVQGIDWEALRLGIGQLPNGADPSDEVGNVVLSAHNDIYGETFRYLDQLEPGDTFQIQTRTELYEYVVIGSDIVEPDATEVLESQGRATVTLISCYPYQVDNQRIVVFAERVN